MDHGLPARLRDERAGALRENAPTAVLERSPKKKIELTIILRTKNVDRSEEHTSELQSHSDLHSFPTRRSSDLGRRRDWNRRHHRNNRRGTMDSVNGSRAASPPPRRTRRRAA